MLFRNLFTGTMSGSRLRSVFCSGSKTSGLQFTGASPEAKVTVKLSVDGQGVERLLVQTWRDDQTGHAAAVKTIYDGVLKP